MPNILINVPPRARRGDIFAIKTANTEVVSSLKFAFVYGIEHSSVGRVLGRIENKEHPRAFTTLHALR